MAWFFTEEEINSEEYTMTGEDARHMEKSLRMKVGETVTLVTPSGMEHHSEISAFTPSGVEVRVISRNQTLQEADIRVTLYQCILKGDKMDFVIQKAVELGVTEIVPVVSSRCVSRPDEKSIRKKVERWQKIALSAAQQSMRGTVPQVSPAVSFEEAVRNAAENSRGIIFYEGGGESLRKLISEDKKENISIFIGSEGGFELSEVEFAKEQGVVSATLGKRILRAETAPLAALSVIMCLSGNMD